MKKAKKVIAIMLTMLTIVSISSAATTVFAAEYVEAQRRTEYFDSALSGYLKNIVDTENAVKIGEKEEVEDAKNRENSTSGMSTFSLRGAQSTSVANALTREEVDIEHNILTLEMENGEKTAYIFSEPVSYMDEDGNLVYKDTSIIPVTDSSILNSGYTYQNSENDYKMYFGADSSVGVLLCSDLGSEIKLIPNGVNVASGYVSSKTIDDIPTDTFEYDGVFGVSSLLRYFPQLNGCKEEIILSSYDGVSRFGFTLLTGDCIAAVNSSGQIEIIDENKNILDTLKVPYAYDSSGGIDMTSEHYADCTYELEKTDDGVYMLTLVVPEDFLTDESTVYPVVIDPTTSTKYMYRDASVYSKYPTNSSFYNNETNCFGKSSDYGFGRVYSFFNLPDDLENYATINSAYFWARETTGRTETMNVRPYIVNNTAWYNSMTWNTKPGYGDYTCSLKNINSNSSDGKGVYWYKFNIAKAVRAWTSGTANRGIVFVSNTEINDAGYLWRAFASMENSTSSYRPYAVISYTNDITAPTVSSVSNPKNGVWTNTNVTVSITASDAASGMASSGYSFDGGSSWQASASKTYSSNGTYTVSAKAKDKAGNISSAKSGGTVKIDKTAPTVSTVSNPKNGVWTNANVTVSITATDTLSGVGSYSFDGGSTWQTGSSKTYSAEGTYTISGKAKDNATNVSSAVSGGTVKIDKTAPVINSVTKSTTEWTRGSVSINIDATDALSGVAHYSFDGGTTWQTSNVYTAIENATLVVKVKDNAGNIATCAEPIVIDNIDKTSPKILATKIVSDGAQFLQIKASDEGSGLPLERYSYDLGETWTWLTFQPIDDDESITIMAKDELNNVATYIYNPGDTTISFEPTLEWTNEDITITVTGYDIIAYDFGNGFDSNNVCVLSENTTIPISTKHAIIGQNPTIEIREWGPLSFTNIDKVAPVISAVNVTPEGEWAKGDVTITVDAADVIEKESDGLSGLQTEAYSFDGGATWQAENTYTVTENGKTLNLAVRDNAGNITAWDEPIIVLIDRLAPATPDIYEENGLVYIIPQDYVEGTASETVQYSLDGTNWADYTEPLDIVRTYGATVYARVIDEAGNVSEEASITLENNLGEYTASYSDIAFGDGLFPVGFDRTYTSTGGWFFTFDANVVKIDDNAYVFTDFYGEKQYFIDSGDGKFENADGEELTITVSDETTTGYSLNYDDMVVEFGADRKLSKITTDYTTTEYTWTDNSLTMTGGVTVTFTDGKPTKINITRDADNIKEVDYVWTDGNLTKFIDAADVEHNYAYSDGKMTANDTETIVYSENGRVKKISQPNGAFVKYTYNDTTANPNDSTSVGLVTISDSRGVTDSVYYTDGFVVSSSFDSYSESAGYSPESISNALTDDISISSMAYSLAMGVTQESETPPYEDLDEDTYIFYKYDSQKRVIAALELEKSILDENNISPDDIEYDFVKDIFLYSNETLYIYSNGYLYREEYYERAQDESVNPVYEYYYDENGNITIETQYDKVVNGTTVSYDPVKTYTRQYDSNNQMTLEYLSELVDGKKILTQKKQYNYDEKKLQSYVLSIYVNEVETTVLTNAYGYNEYGNLVYNNEAHYATDENAYDVSYMYEYDYDVWNQLITETLLDIKSSQAFDTEITRTNYDELGRVISTCVDFGEITSYNYDNNGNVIKETTGDNITQYTYQDGNLISKTNPDGTIATYTYDSYGNLLSHSYNDYNFTYNTLGNILTANIGSQELTEYYYSDDTVQNVPKTEFANGQSIDYTYNEAGEITKIESGGAIIFEEVFEETENESSNSNTRTFVDYASKLETIIEDNRTTVNDTNVEENAEPTFLYYIENTDEPQASNDYLVKTVKTKNSRFTLKSEENKDTLVIDNFIFYKYYENDHDGNLWKVNTFGALSTEYGYNERCYTSSVEHTLDNQTQLYTYGFDENGNIITEVLTTTSSDAEGATTETNEATVYTYDEDTNELLSAENSTTKWVYTYDSRGNLESEIEYSVVTDENNVKTYTEVYKVEYDYDNVWKDKLVGYGTQSITYDALGNPTSYLGNTVTWTRGRQLASFGNNTYTYNEDGIRTSKTVDGDTTKFYLDGTNIIEQDNGAEVISFHYDSKGELTSFRYKNALYIYVKNAMGDITGIVDRSGTLVASYTYDPWGKVISITGNTEIGEANPFRYRGYYYDSDIEMYYLQSRYYDPEVGRFINSDDVSFIGATGSEISYNPFAYCENNPVNGCDPSGCADISDFLDLLGKVVDFIAQIVSLCEKLGEKSLNKLKAIGVAAMNSKQKKNYKAELQALEETKRLSKILGVVGYAISLASLIRVFVTTKKKNNNGLYAFATIVSEITVELICRGISWIAGKLCKLVPYVGFLLKSLVSIGAGYLLKLYFTADRVYRIGQSIYRDLKNSPYMSYSLTMRRVFIRTLV